MKKIIFILGLAAVVLGTSCSDVLDLNPVFAGDRLVHHHYG